MNNYYHVLGVSHDAAPTVIKIAYEGKVKALAKADLTDAERRVEERLLEQAHVTLSNPAKRQWFDKQFAKQVEAEHKAAAHKGFKGLAVATAFLVVMVAGIAYWKVEQNKERERVRIEEQRIALEKEKLRAQADIEKARLDESQAQLQYRQDVEARNRAARDRAYVDRYSRTYQNNAFGDQVRERALSTFDERRSQYNDDRNRMISDQERRKAWAEVERQNQFVRQREAEEERIRADKHYRAQREAEVARSRDRAEEARTPRNYR
jgi:curved DNA-binding protein CbpA